MRGRKHPCRHRWWNKSAPKLGEALDLAFRITLGIRQALADAQGIDNLAPRADGVTKLVPEARPEQ